MSTHLTIQHQALAQRLRASGMSLRDIAKRNDLAKEIIRMTESKSQVVFRRLPSDDPITREPDNSKAKRILKWKPKISREIGLKKTIIYFRNELSRDND